MRIPRGLRLLHRCFLRYIFSSPKGLHSICECQLFPCEIDQITAHLVLPGALSWRLWNPKDLAYPVRFQNYTQRRVEPFQSVSSVGLLLVRVV